MKNERRKFIHSVATATLLVAISSKIEAKDRQLLKKNKNIQVLEGSIFYLTIEESLVNITGKIVPAKTINGIFPGPTLKWREGDTVTIHVTNKLSVSTSIHWHGIILPYHMDGVPGISFKGINPGETFTYNFKVEQHGTYWYHSHTNFQEQVGLHGAIIITPKEPEPFAYDRDYVVSLFDWSNETPSSIYQKLKINSDYYNFNRRTIGNFLEEVKNKGLVQAYESRKMWNEMRMSDRDLADVTGYEYSFLMNGLTSNQNWTERFKHGEKIRLRFINESAMTIFDIQIPGLKLRIVAADGGLVLPVNVDEFRIGVAETYDVIIEPDEKNYCIFAQSLGRFGYAAGTLTPYLKAKAIRPNIDPPQPLTMTDMGMKKDKNQKIKDNVSNLPITKLPIKWGINTAMRAKYPQYRLNDPGVGLRNNGRRVLTYADLKNYYSTALEPRPTREIILHLTGNMERYIWSINGITYVNSLPLKFYYGERLRITFINDTIMNHPMHLHGMWSDLETGDDNRLVRKHTILVQPGSKISYRVTVNAKGAWAFHCHLLYHLPQMFRKVEVIS